jgi:hypothetical protein
LTDRLEFEAGVVLRHVALRVLDEHETHPSRPRHIPSSCTACRRRTASRCSPGCRSHHRIGRRRSSSGWHSLALPPTRRSCPTKRTRAPRASSSGSDVR